jgi:hypothetical protein
MKSRGPCLPKPLNLDQGDGAMDRTNFSKHRLRPASDNDAVNDEPKRGSESRADVLARPTELRTAERC